MRVPRILLLSLLICSTALAIETRLPFKTVFKGQDQFNRLVSLAKSNDWKSLPIGERTAVVGQALTGTRYKSYTLEIDSRIESPSVNFNGLDCWTFFETSLAFARMLNESEANWTPENFLHYIELDRYRGGVCTGEYLSRLHYLEDWLYDNDKRGLVEDLTTRLGGQSVPAALSLPRSKQIAARTARANGGGRFETTALPNSKKSRRQNRTEASERRHHRHRFARRPIVFDITCRPRAADPRRRFAFLARFGSAQLRQGGRRLAAFRLPEEVPKRFGNPGRAAAALGPSRGRRSFGDCRCVESLPGSTFVL